MIPKIHLVGAWSGVVFITLFFIGFWPLAHYLPGHNPTASAVEISEIYQNNTLGIRVGMLFIMLGGGFFLPYNVTLVAMVRRMEGESTFLSQTLFAGAIAASIFFFLPALFWEMAAFRPERAPELTQLLNDAGWLLLITAVPPFILQSMPLAVAILLDKNPQPLFPRWFAYFTLWGDTIYLTGMAAYFFKVGPFAWNGLFPYWLVFAVYGTWILMVTVMMIKIINRPNVSELPS